MDPLPMHGRDMGVHPDDMIEVQEAEQETKREVLENKDVSFSYPSYHYSNYKLFAISLAKGAE